MDLYFAPLACSMASRIALYEAGETATFIQADTRTKRLPDGGDLRAINPMGQVPVLRTDDGAILTENPAVLTYLADRFPSAKLLPADRLARAALEKWLSFVGSELHVGIYMPLLDPKADDAVKAYIRTRIALRFGTLENHLKSRRFLGDAFSVADAYLFVALNWSPAVGIDLAEWPAIEAYKARIAARPAVALAFGEEVALYKAAKKNLS